MHLVGGFAGGSRVAETSDETWDKMMNINLRAAFCCIRAALKPMQAAGRGRIVAVGTRMAVEPSPNFAAYAVSKAALVALIKNVAAEGQKFGVTANVILPSTIDTPANRAAMPKVDFSRWVEAGVDREAAGVSGVGRGGGYQWRGDSYIREGLNEDEKMTAHRSRPRCRSWPDGR